jgi:hypothetical protein
MEMEAVNKLTPADVDWSDPSQWPGPNLPAPEPDLPEPAGKPDPRARVMQLLGEAGPAGTTPQQITDRLQGEGYGTVRQTVAGWLAEAVESGEAVRLARGTYGIKP